MRRLSRKLVLEALSRSGDGAGGFTGGWVALGTHWGEVAPATGRIERGEEGARALARYRITVRAVAPTSPARPKAGQRFREGVRIFAIRSVLQDGDARYLTCIADEEEAA